MAGRFVERLDRIAAGNIPRGGAGRAGEAITNGWVCRPRSNHYVGVRPGVRIGQSARDINGGCSVLNRYDRPPPMAGEADVKFLDGDFRVIRPGAFVRCAVTGVPIPLEELKYWSVDLQEAYASPEAVLQRHFPEAVK